MTLSHPGVPAALMMAALLTAPSHSAPSENGMRTVAGTGSSGYSGDGGPAVKAQLNEPFGVCFGPKEEMYIADSANHCIREVDAQGNISTVAGTGKKGYTGDGGPATAATLNEPYAVIADARANLFIVDRLNACIRYVDRDSGKIVTIAGNGTKGYSGDGRRADQAQLKEPNGLALDRQGDLYIADVEDNRIRKVDLRTGIITTLCGTGERRDSGDGDVAAEASLNGARAVAVDAEGNVYICEREGNRVREIEHKAQIIHTIAGNGKAGYTGDGKAATEATLRGPKWIHVDANGAVYVVDTENHCVRRVDPNTGIIRTVAGCGTSGGKGDGGLAAKAQLNRPHGCTVHNGLLYIADSENHRIRVCPLLADPH